MTYLVENCINFPPNSVLGKPKYLLTRFSSIGDIVLTTPIIRCLKRQLQAELHFITKPQFVEIVAANPYLSKCWSLDERSNQQITALNEEKFDAVIDLHNNLRSRKISLKLGIPSHRFNKLNIEKWMYVNFKYPLLPDIHIVDRYFQAYEKLGINNDGEGLDFFFDDSIGLYKKLPSEFYAIALGAAHFTKQIPESILLQILSHVQLPVILLGGPDESKLGQSLESKFDHVTNMAGLVNIPGSAKIITKSKFLVTPDTGMMHTAAALKKPTIVVWGSTAVPFGMYPYYGDQDIPSFYSEVNNLSCRPCTKMGKSKCPKTHFKCMLDQNVDLLIKKIEEFFNS